MAATEDDMTDKIKDGGPAFPVAEDHRTADQFPWTQGMSLRDYFAGQALGALINYVYLDAGYEFDEDMKLEDPHAEISRRAYAIADALIAAREAGK